MKKSIVSATALSFMLVVFNISPVFADTQVQDHYKNVIHKTPHSVEVCYDKSVSGDKTGDTLRGAILGGIIRSEERRVGKECRVRWWADH